jgi:hypothetical protein
MDIGEILIWESSNLLLLTPVMIGLVMLARWQDEKKEKMKLNGLVWEVQSTSHDQARQTAAALVQQVPRSFQVDDRPVVVLWSDYHGAAAGVRGAQAAID